jgi:molybdopterin converting factor small subunit
VNGDEPLAGDLTELHDGDEVAVLPPVSGGSF